MMLCFIAISCTSKAKTLNQKLDTNENRYEARSWLRENAHISALAGNRFSSKKEAIDFVESLYSAGATTVYVTNIFDEDWRLKEEGGPYADTIIVELPSDLVKRASLIKIMNEEIENEGFEPVSDTGQKEITLWWD